MILINDLRLMAQIGVPEGERAAAQEIALFLRIEPQRDFADMSDDLALTIDYAAVCERVKSLAGERPRRLIETLADTIADAILRDFSARSVEVEIRKFILPDTRYVAVRCVRTL